MKEEMKFKIETLNIFLERYPEKLKEFLDSLDEEKKRWGFVRNLKEGLCLVEKRTSKIIGLILLTRGRSISIVVKKEYQDKKYGQLLLEEFLKKLKGRYVKATVFTDNPKSVNLFLKNGFQWRETRKYKGGYHWILGKCLED